MELLIEGKGLLTVSVLEEVLKNYLASLDVKDNSKNLYKRTLQVFFRWCLENNYSLSELTRVEILKYKSDLLTSGKSPLSVGSYLTSLKSFYNWIEANRYGHNIAKGVKLPKRKQQFKKQPLTPPQATELLEYCSNELSLRDFAVVNLIIRTGLRTIEVSRALIEDITFKGGKRVLLVHGKGRDEKDDFVVLTPKSYQPLKEYIESRTSADAKEPLFTSTSNNSKGATLTTRSISKVVKEALKSIGLDHRSYTAHSLRHTTAVNILRAGGSIETAQHTLRHTNPATTQIYTATIREEQRLANSGEALLDNIF